MNIFKIIKYIIYFVSGILILIFHNFFLEYIAFTVSTVMLLEALEDIVIWVKRGIAKEGTKFFEALVLIILAISLILVRNDLTRCLVIWAVWMILSEGKEITNCVQRFIRRRPAFVNTIESIFVIVMSVILIVYPNEHHAHIHIYILGIELICEVVFHLIDLKIDKYLDEKEKNKDDNL